jgi:hypothetical protein
MGLLVPQTASKLAALQIRPSSYPGSTPTLWFSGTMAHYWRFGIPELWHTFLPVYIRTLLHDLKGGRTKEDEVFLGIRISTWTGAVIELLGTMIVHPFHVANLHYLALPFHAPSATGFRSTRDAFVQLFRLGPANLFTGLPMAMISSAAVPFVRELVSRLQARIRNTPAISPISRYFAEPLVVLFQTPTRVLSMQAMAQTPFLRPYVANFSFSPISHVMELWMLSGIRGFFAGLPMGLLAATGRSLLSNFFNFLLSNHYRRNALFHAPFIFIVLITFFAADVSPRLFQPGSQLTTIHDENPSAHRSTIVY